MILMGLAGHFVWAQAWLKGLLAATVAAAQVVACKNERRSGR
jgi:hypothetical protein